MTTDKKKKTVLENLVRASLEFFCARSPKLSKDEKFLSLDELHEKFGLKVNYRQYFKIIAAIPRSLKQTALQTPISSKCLFQLLIYTTYPKTVL